MPDWTSEEKTLPQQAIIYRLNGDTNPLHIDPKASTLGGFERPILHGLCFYGFTSRMVYDKFGNNDPSTIKKVSARFTSHVYPGESLIVDMWKDSKGGKIYYEARTKERNLVVLKGIMEFKGKDEL